MSASSHKTSSDDATQAVPADAAPGYDDTPTDEIPAIRADTPDRRREALEKALAAIEASTERLVDRVAKLDKGAVREPSLLPDWTRGHVATHVARNAEALMNLLAWASTGQPTPMYLSAQARAEGIEAGARRSPADLAADIEAAAAAFAAAARELPPAAWDAEVTLMNGTVAPARWALPARHREVELHHVDLGAGYSAARWDLDFVEEQLAVAAAVLSEADGAPDVLLRGTDLDPPPAASASITGPIPLEPGKPRPPEPPDPPLPTWHIAGQGPPVTVAGPRRALLAWVSGRASGDGLQATDGELPELPPWP